MSEPSSISSYHPPASSTSTTRSTTSTSASSSSAGSAVKGRGGPKPPANIARLARGRGSVGAIVRDQNEQKNSNQIDVNDTHGLINDGQNSRNERADDNDLDGVESGSRAREKNQATPIADRLLAVSLSGAIDLTGASDLRGEAYHDPAHCSSTVIERAHPSSTSSSSTAFKIPAVPHQRPHHSKQPTSSTMHIPASPILKLPQPDASRGSSDPRIQTPKTPVIRPLMMSSASNIPDRHPASSSTTMTANKLKRLSLASRPLSSTLSSEQEQGIATGKPVDVGMGQRTSAGDGLGCQGFNVDARNEPAGENGGMINNGQGESEPDGMLRSLTSPGRTPTSSRIRAIGMRSSISYSPRSSTPGRSLLDELETAREDDSRRKGRRGSESQNGRTAGVIDGPRGVLFERDDGLGVMLDGEAGRVDPARSRAKGETMADRHGDLLRQIAQRERAVNELRRELESQEASLALLKSRYTELISQTYSATAPSPPVPSPPPSPRDQSHSPLPSLSSSGIRTHSNSTSILMSPPASIPDPGRTSSSSLSSRSIHPRHLTYIPSSTSTSATFSTTSSSSSSASHPGDKTDISTMTTTDEFFPSAAAIQNLISSTLGPNINAEALVPISQEVVEGGKRFWGNLMRTVGAAAGGTVPAVLAGTGDRDVEV